jgi:hypothetical protein
MRAFGYVLLIFLTGVGSSVGMAEPTFLNQNWSEADRQWFYTTSQGSQMMPYSWFQALEEAGNQRQFIADGLTRFGYLPNPARPDNPDPDGLPVGFVKDTTFGGRAYVGMTCAACHTNQITYEGATFQIDGGPTLADMGELLTAIDEAVEATLKDESKFTRFARSVLGNEYTNSTASSLKAQVGDFHKYWSQFVADSTPEHAWGRARLDAFGMIFNRVSAIDTKIPGNSVKPEAPVSYPFLWGTSFEDKVQWNGIAPNTNDAVRLVRNVGEVLGVFASADLTRRATPLFSYYNTSTQRIKQVRLENKLKKLWSPKWPEGALGQIDLVKKELGKALFEKNCVECHTIVPHGKQHTPIKVKMTPLDEIGTDPKMARNALKHTAKTGPLQGAKLFFDVFGSGLPEEMPTAELLKHVVAGAVLDPTPGGSRPVWERTGGEKSGSLTIDFSEFEQAEGPLEALAEELYGMKKGGEEALVDDIEAFLYANADALKSNSEISEEQNELLAYKGRPMDGIWATGPYLHNGSVPNLYQLLLPPEERVKQFYVGNPEFDPKHVGLVMDERPGSTTFDTTLPGNRNTGHDYGKFVDTEEYTAHEQRMQLVEYMKSL